MIYVIDFGSQTAHLIQRRIRDFGIQVKLIEPENALNTINRFRPQGIILSGGPTSVYLKNAPTLESAIFNFGIPILGICYGWQLTAKLLQGTVISGNKEYGPTIGSIRQHNSLFSGINDKHFTVWMSHGDEVTKLPSGFEYLFSTKDVQAAGVGDLKRNIYGVQFHPEVEHTQHGLQILKNFAKLVCRLNLRPKKLDVQAVINRVRAQADLAGKNSRAISAVSGGVDSTVASAIVAKAIGNRFTPVFCDNGLMRLGTRDEVNFIFKDLLHVKPTIIHCQTQFLKALKGVTDPEQKRKLIGKLYIQNFEKEANKIGDIHWLVQGTIYSDVIESQGTKHSSKIKSHHNVGGLPKRIQLRLLEPVRDFYKDEVRELGRQLGLPKAVVNKEPFPGPGQAIRIIGEITNKRLQTHQHADQIVTEELDKSGWRDRVFQGFPILTGIKSTAVKGDDRVYGEVIALRIFGSNDIMTAGWLHLPYDVLQTISTRIVNEIPGVSRVVYDITTKPPATMEWE